MSATGRTPASHEMLRSGGEKPRVARSVTDSKEAGPSLVHPEVGAALPSRLKDLSGVELSDFAVSKARTENPTQASFFTGNRLSRVAEPSANTTEPRRHCPAGEAALPRRAKR